MLRSPKVTPITAIGVVLFGLIFFNRHWQQFIAMNFDLLLRLRSRGIVSIPKLYRVGLALLAQDEHFMKLVLYILRTDELAQDELFIQLATLDQDDARGWVWSTVFWHHHKYFNSSLQSSFLSLSPLFPPNPPIRIFIFLLYLHIDYLSPTPGGLRSHS